MAIAEKRKNAEFLAIFEQLTDINKAKVQERAIFLLEEQHSGKVIPIKPPKGSQDG